MSNKITEGLIKLGYDFEQVIPTEVDFKAFEDRRVTGSIEKGEFRLR